VEETSENKNFGVLEYHTPVPRRWPGFIRWFISAGPWWIGPSRRSAFLLLPLLTCLFALWLQPPSWVPGRKRALTPCMPSFPGTDTSTSRPSSNWDALFCIDTNGDPILWRPWDDRVLQRFRRPHLGNVIWLSPSGDGSKLLAAVNGDGLLLWDSRTGVLVHQLTGWPAPYLPREAQYTDSVALSRTGNMLALTTWGQNQALTLWDISGPAARRISSIPWVGPTSSGSLYFSPDDSLLAEINRGSVYMRSVPALNGVPLNPASAAFASKASHVAVSPDGRMAIDGKALFYDCLHSTDLTQLSQPAIHDLPVAFTFPQGVAAFFPDNRRAAVIDEFSSAIDVLDVVDNVQLAVIPLSIASRNTRIQVTTVLVSADQHHIAAVLANGQVHVFDQILPDSRWGLLASPWYILTAIALTAVSYSLWRDACRLAKEVCRPIGSATMVIIGIVALMGLLGTIDSRSNSPSADARLVAWSSIALWLPAALCIRAGSRGWKILARFILVFSAFIGFAISAQTQQGIYAPVHILDRVWIFSSWAIMYATLAFSLLCGALFVRLFIERQEPQLSA
jgi:hypothetical protein